MIVEQHYTNCLSEAAYFIASDGEAAVVDPMRDCEVYLDLAKKNGATIKYIFETHFHADFISGHLELSQKTGATIVYGPETLTGFPVHIAQDGERLKIGKLEMEVLHTPGHTPESTCYLLHDESGKDFCLFTGDTLFVGDVGRPDLFGAALTKEDLASRMYDSLQRVKQLPDDLIIYPAHGPGSACGKNLGKETWSTLGVQKKTNYALQDMNREDFIEAITGGLTAPPQYFPLNAKINREGHDLLDDVMNKSMRALSANEFESEMKKEHTVVVDTRHEETFVKGFVPGSVFIGLNGRFAEWVGTILKMNDRILIVADPGKEQEAIIRMARVGYDGVVGFLDGGFASWQASGKTCDMLVSIDADELQLDYNFGDLHLVDVRKQGEYENGHVEKAMNVVLQYLDDQVQQVQDLKAEPVYLYCQGGYRSVIAASLLRKKGFQNLRNVKGGYMAITKTQLPIETPSFSAS